MGGAWMTHHRKNRMLAGLVAGMMVGMTGETTHRICRRIPRWISIGHVRKTKALTRMVI